MHTHCGCLRTQYWEYFDLKEVSIKTEKLYNYILSFIICTYPNYQWNYHMKDNDMGEHVAWMAEIQNLGRNQWYLINTIQVPCISALGCLLPSSYLN